MSFASAAPLRMGPGIRVRSTDEAVRDRAPTLTIAIPANNEQERIPACLAALAMQRDEAGDPIASGVFDVLLFANNCTDATAGTALALSDSLPFRLDVIEDRLPPDRSNAGHARKRAMDLAAERLADRSGCTRAILTTDADSRVGPTWISATLRAFARGADCVAGYIDADPVEILRLGPAFLKRGRLEDHYIRLVAEIEARCDPRPHDPWPNHRVSSGASLAVTLDAYQAIGGLPPLPLGEDAALTRHLDAAGFRVRHATDVCVTTSCRLDGRAAGGAAETMRQRHLVPDAPCDDDLEPASQVLRRARLRARLRHAPSSPDAQGRIARSLALSREQLGVEVRRHAGRFPDLWCAVEASSPVLARSRVLRPSDLPTEIGRAERVLDRLRRVAGPAEAIEAVDRVMQPRSLETVLERGVLE